MTKTKKMLTYYVTQCRKMPSGFNKVVVKEIYPKYGVDGLLYYSVLVEYYRDNGHRWNKRIDVKVDTLRNYIAHKKSWHKMDFKDLLFKIITREEAPNMGFINLNQQEYDAIRQRTGVTTWWSGDVTASSTTVDLNDIYNTYTTSVNNNS